MSRLTSCNTASACMLVIAATLGVKASSAARAADLVTLVKFDNVHGSSPAAGLTLSGNTLYGTTQYGGADGFGTVFSVPIVGGTPTTLGSFGYYTNGAFPRAGVLLSGNTLYGTTSGGGANLFGAVFSVPISGGTPALLGSFNSGANGSDPVAGLTLVGSTLYGTAEKGGVNYNSGVVFSIPLAGGSPTPLVTFVNSNGAYPRAGLTLSGSTLYGTTSNGGNDNNGTVYSLPVGSSTSTVIATFNVTNGANPLGGLIVSGNTLYGTTGAGGENGLGTVFSVPLAGGTPTTLASFDGTNGAYPVGGLTLSNGVLYGTTTAGGTDNDGTVFSLPLEGGTPTVLASFDGANGASPAGDLVFSGDTLYGTTSSGGIDNNGTVFAVTLPEPISCFVLAAVGTLVVRRRR